MIKAVLTSLLAILTSFYGIAQEKGEFNGPFPSWLDAKKNFGAKGDGKSDDTKALQAGLDAAATDPGHTVLYLPAGTYRISSTLAIDNKINISVIGEDPASVSITWFGAQHGTLLKLNGTAYSKFDRITFNGRGLADVAVDQSWDGKKPHFDTGNEYADDVFTDVSFGIRGGALGNGFAETSILRDKFIRNSQAGISLGNFNALDIWVRQCLFQDCAYGITNIFGAGNFKVYGCVFRHSLKSDLQMSNTGEFSVRGNTSIGSAQFFIAGFTRNPACITLEGNTVLDPVNMPAIAVSDQGPVIFIHNTIRCASNTSSAVVRFGTDSYCDGNTFSSENALVAGSGSIIRNNRVVPVSALKGLRAWSVPGAAPKIKRTIFEVPAGADAAHIQAIINHASKLKGHRPVVHFPFGTYQLTTALLLPSGTDIQLIGDGFGDQRGTTLAWAGSANGTVVRIQGPSTVTLEDLTLRGGSRTTNLLIDHMDQHNAQVFLREFHQVGGETGLLADRLDQTRIFGQDVAFSGLKTAMAIIGGASPKSTAQTIIYSGAESDNVLSHQVSAGGKLRIQDTWYEGRVQSVYANLSGSSFFSATGSHIAIQPNTDAISLRDFSGKVLFAADDLTGVLNPSGLKPPGQLLAVGLLAENESFLSSMPPAKNQFSTLINRGRTHGSTVLNGGSYKLDDMGDFRNWSADDLIISQIKHDAQPDQTNIGLYRVMSIGGAIGLDVKP